MTNLTLTNYALGNTTVLENEFIDQYMVKANGEYVKVYLLLLRHMNRPDGILTVSEMADLLECTEKDVRRALNYWKKQELLDYCEQTEARNLEDTIRVSNLPSSTENTSAIPACEPPGTNIQQYRNRHERKEYKELMFVAEQ